MDQDKSIHDGNGNGKYYSAELVTSDKPWDDATRINTNKFLRASAIKTIRYNGLIGALGQAPAGYYSVYIHPMTERTDSDAEGHYIPSFSTHLIECIEVHPVVTEVLTRIELPPMDWGTVKIETFRQWIKRHVGL